MPVWLKFFILFCFSLAVFYPLSYGFIFKQAWGKKRQKMHLALPNVIGGLVVVTIIFLPIAWFSKALVLFWKIVLLGLSRHSWKKGEVDCWLMAVPSLIGLLALYGLLLEFFPRI